MNASNIDLMFSNIVGTVAFQTKTKKKGLTAKEFHFKDPQWQLYLQPESYWTFMFLSLSPFTNLITDQIIAII